MDAALIISAGKTNQKDRFTPEKLIGRITAIERIALLFEMCSIDRIVVVGDETELPQKLVPSMNLTFLTASSGCEMLDSIKQGLNFLQDKCRRVLISYVDVPMFSVDTVEKLLQSEGEVCIPTYKGRGGHPILLKASAFPDILEYRGAGGLKGAIESSRLAKRFVATEDAGILSADKSGQLLDSLLQEHDVSRLRASFKIRISKEKVFYGPGVHHLLELTEESGSLASACQYMGMSYSKGRKLISIMEKELGKPVLESRQGGEKGGYSKPTAVARQIMQAYRAFEEEAKTELEKIFEKHFKALDL